MPPAAVEDFYRRSDPGVWDLKDLGYLARIHPLELWVVRRLLHNPNGSLSDVLEASREVRQDVYGWLFRTRLVETARLSLRQARPPELTPGI